MSGPSSAAAPSMSRIHVNSHNTNTRTDEAAGRRAEKRSRYEQSQAEAAQVAKQVLGIETVTDRAMANFGRINVYA
ncbi:MAG: hypothetical protein KAR01_09280 [Desulfocapsa sp.]|nr:hypothetical protein [Desulfocapsa sp.]